MPKTRVMSPEIKDFILRRVAANPDTIGPLTAKHFGVSRTTVSNYMHWLVEDGLLSANGNTRARSYERRPIRGDQFQVRLMRDKTSEDVIWRFRVLPNFEGYPQNIINLCQYGFTEMLNNCIDHSASMNAIVYLNMFYDEIEISVMDTGIGIFEKIKNHFSLIDHRHALLELAKGKLTSDRSRHSGEGVFFTSRMFNKFILTSGHLYYQREMTTDADWLIETHDIAAPTKGTAVRMSLSTDATWDPRDVFGKYQESGNISFRKTHVPIKLGTYPGEQLVSRSQAKRIIARFGDFSEIILDFSGIQQVGQAFADEVFRIFPEQHPEIALISIGKSPEVEKMIEYVKKGSARTVNNDLFDAGIVGGDAKIKSDG
jgi:anti-sigma regulatory factor (Ser/Thr protein kinase)